MRSDNPFSPGFGAPPEVFFGRDDYLELVRHAMADLHDRYRIFFLEGTRGSGKTVLLHQLAEEARRNRWFVCEMSSLHAAAEFEQDLLGALPAGKRLTATFNPQFSVPGIGSASIGAVSGEMVPADRERLLGRTLVSFLERRSRWKGVLVAIDEAQKLSAEDAQEVCVAVQEARMRGLDVMFVLAGLPGTKECISGYPGCTFMRRAPRLVLGTLLRDETIDALASSFAKVPEIRLSDEAIRELAHFTQGHPYLVQLVGDSVYRLVDELHGESVDGSSVVVEPSEGELLFARERAYEIYREDVLEPVIAPLKKGTVAYLRAIIETMEADGVMSNDAAVARALGKERTQDTGPTRQRLIDLCILESVGRGKLAFVIPYIPRYLKDEAYERSITRTREGRWNMEV